MGFDKDDGKPLLQTRRWGTKVNLAVAAGVVVFLIFGIVAVLRFHAVKG